MNLGCSIETNFNDRILLAHGGGGSWTHHLLETLFFSEFQNEILLQNNDSGIINGADFNSDQIAVTTDSFVVDPIFFPGGDIGKLAAVGSINDLAVMGARPLYMTVSFILEEGLQIDQLRKIVCSLACEAKNLGVQIVAGDTKVVAKGKADKIFINTTAVGTVQKKMNSQKIEIGDAIILSRDIGCHGMAVLASRENLQVSVTLQSDCHELWTPIEKLILAGVNVKCARDLTRGGLATALIELSESSGKDFDIFESQIPVHPEVEALSELLGIEVPYVANEGSMVLFVNQNDVEKTLSLLRKFTFCANANSIGKVGEKRNRPKVYLNLNTGLKRQWLRLSGEQLPRIC
jgi:hydrogenase expression/formation protein HypE